VVRTSWVFGPGRNFVAAILDQGRKRRTGEQRGPLRVVSDQRGTPTYAADLAEGLLSLLPRMTREAEADRVTGLLHLRNGGETTWFEFARAILDLAGFEDLAIEPVTTDTFPTPAPRPAYSVLDVSRASDLGVELPPWTDALSRYLAGPDRPEGWDPIGVAAAADGSELPTTPETTEVTR
jgi:dTDP-4-dehydrorhamnose reductase